MNIDEIKVRQLTNQYLVCPGKRMSVIKDICGVQAQITSNAVHALRIRCSDFDEEHFCDGLVRNWTLRGTMHLFAETDLPLFLHEGRERFLRECDTLCGDDHISAERKRYFADLILTGIGEGVTGRSNLKEYCYSHGMTFDESKSLFDSWGGMLRALCEEGRICYTADDKKAFMRCSEFIPMEKEAAEVELARRYFTNMGPATVHDAMYFFHASATRVKRLMSALPLESVDCSGKTYYWIDNSKVYDKEIPKWIFLAGFDQLMLAYDKRESLYLPAENIRDIFTLSGMIYPALLLDGHVVGRWKKKDSHLALELFKKVAKSELFALEERADELWSDVKKIDYI